MSRRRTAVTPAGLRSAALTEHIDRTTPWAIRPSTLAAITSAMRGDVSAEEVQRLAAVSTVSEQRISGAVAVIPLRGVITPRGSLLAALFGMGGGGLEGFRRSFAEALDDDEVSAIVIDIDSPGGLVDHVTETAAVVREARGTKPIVAIANTLAASAAYWIASAADELVVTPSGEVGSIGVYVAHEDWSKFDEDMGVVTTLISAGRYKVDGNMLEPLSETARAHLQDQVDAIYDQFTADVAAGRGVPVATVKSGFGEGRVVNADDALAEGMVDRIATLEDVVAGLLAGESLRTGARALSAEIARAVALAQERAVLAQEREALDESLARVTEIQGSAMLEALMERLATRTSEAVGPAASELPDHDTSQGDSSSAAPPDEREVATAATEPSWLLIPTPRHPMATTQEA